MFNGDLLRELGTRQRQLVYALMLQVKALANAAGHKVSQDTARGLEDILHAALADEGAAEQLRAGRLTDTLQRTRKRNEQLARAKAQDAGERQDQAGAAVRDAASLVSRLRADLDKAQVEQSRREQEHRKSQADLDRANRVAREATCLLEDAQRRQRSSP